jgi:hypothetical protein
VSFALFALLIGVSATAAASFTFQVDYVSGAFKLEQANVSGNAFGIDYVLGRQKASFCPGQLDSLVLSDAGAFNGLTLQKDFYLGGFAFRLTDVYALNGPGEKFLGHRINDPSIHRLIRRILKVGYMEEGRKYRAENGTPQGGVISPILANVYLHYVLDLWFEKVIKLKSKGEAYLVRSADDFVCCFQYKEEAESFYHELQARLEKFNLSIATEKTKIIEFGRFATENRDRKGKGKPDTFDFLGFTHYCSKSEAGKFRVKRKTSRKKFKAKLAKMKEWIRGSRTTLVWELVDKLREKLLGHYQYYGITDNIRMLIRYQYEVNRLLYKWLNRRSQRKSFTWEKFNLFLKKCKFPRPKINVNIYEFKLRYSYIKLMMS